MTTLAHVDLLCHLCTMSPREIDNRSSIYLGIFLSEIQKEYKGCLTLKQFRGLYARCANLTVLHTETAENIVTRMRDQFMCYQLDDYWVFPMALQARTDDQIVQWAPSEEPWQTYYYYCQDPEGIPFGFYNYLHVVCALWNCVDIDHICQNSMSLRSDIGAEAHFMFYGDHFRMKVRGKQQLEFLAALNLLIMYGSLYQLCWIVVPQ